MKKKLKNNNFDTAIIPNLRLPLFFSFLFFLLSFTSKAQLADFTLTITKTDQSCPGNGTLTFFATNTSPGATINYKIYKLPNITTEIANLSTNFLGGLTNGTYVIVATQTLGSDTNTQTQEITINNTIVPLDFSVTHTDAVCGNDASITINVTSGTAVSYEITSGPIIIPPQTSNVFNSLPAGVYQVRVFDNCGGGHVETRTILSTQVNMSVTSGSFPDVELPACNQINVSHDIISTNQTIIYPLQYQITVYPPGNATPVVINGTIANGPASESVLSQQIPFYHDQVYSYNLQVTNGCGTIYISNNNIVNQKLTAILSTSLAECGEFFLIVTLSKFVAPFTISFLSAPEDFDETTYNIEHPGPFNSETVNYGSETLSVPFGDYTIQVTDSCGRTAIATQSLENIPSMPVVTVTPGNGCNATTGNIEISVPPFTLETAIITIAPTNYPNPLSDDVSNFIDPEDGLILIDIPVGTYFFTLIDTCGNEYTAEATIPTIGSSNLGFNTRADCEIGTGTIRVRSLGSTLTFIEITAAPAAFSQTLPYNVSFDIAENGIFSMDNLPPGNYTFNTLNACGATKTITATVYGYAVSNNDFTMTQNCGSFDFHFNHSSNGVVSQSFWLQKFDPVANSWVHPITNVAYPEGAIPTTGNSMSLTNNTTTYNISVIGTFRIIKRFEAFENGSINNVKDCIDVIQEFAYTGELEIIGLQNLSCTGGNSDIEVLVNGTFPLNYRIIEKNGQPFIIDNAAASIFVNLEPAVYKFEVSDACGDIRTYEFDVALLPSAVVANQPENLIVCDDESQDLIETFSLSSVTSAILGSQPEPEYSVKYYASEANATAQINELPNQFVSGNQQIFARVSYINKPECIAITSFFLEVKPYPTLGMESVYSFCAESNVTVFADSGYDTYTWSDGQTGNAATFNQPGNYSVTFTKEYGDVVCEGIHYFQIDESNAPSIVGITVTDWTNNDNTITVFVDENGIGDYVYSLDNNHFQEENIFYGLEPGAYTVYVKDRNGCGPDAVEDVFLLNYPNFFTPNGDGYNDYWRIKYAMMEPKMLVYIFDRYGKLITGFGANSQGWDGTLNGKPLPSTDYWFLVIRENGKEHRGHFSMKR